MARRKPKDRVQPNAVADLDRYIERIVDPTIEDFQKDLNSQRRAFLACVATYHAIDRAVKNPANYRHLWGKKCPEFGLIDYMAHTFKHVEVGGPTPMDTIPMGALIGSFAFNTTAFNESGMSPRNLMLACRAAIHYVRDRTVEMAQVSNFGPSEP